MNSLLGRGGDVTSLFLAEPPNPYRLGIAKKYILKQHKSQGVKTPCKIRRFWRQKLVAPQSFGFLVRSNALQGFSLDLADALTRDAELLPHFLERVVNAVFESMAQFQNLALFGR